jgi:hypothetical protein
VRRRLSELMEDPEPVMQQLVRVFIDDGTFLYSVAPPAHSRQSVSA